MNTGRESIPLVSDRLGARSYARRMKEKTPLGWGARFRQLAKGKKSSLAKIAERLGRAESTLRSWTNGTRDINLAEFLELCDAAGLSPALVLFSASGKSNEKEFLAIEQAWAHADERGQELLLVAAEAAERLRESTTSNGHRRSASTKR
jgi:transcriptional regulator with XRE-family HTH domain